MLINTNSRKLQRGQGMTEYIIIVALVAVAAIVAFQFFGTTVRETVAGVTQEVAGKSSATQITAAGTAAGTAATDATKIKSLDSYGVGK
jgi:Flp pilus assembly pilin Flp